MSEHLDALMAIDASASQSVYATSLMRCATDAMGASHCSVVLLFESRRKQPRIKLWGCRDVRILRGGTSSIALDGVLSSGDGAVGKSFHGELPNFAAIHHAFPASFVAMSQTRFDALPDELRVKLDQAALSIQVSNPMRRAS
ncbi:hypothetical protein [Burkholderia diffusa]|uniref:hypothetical protein n=1 Tax=Burkholderia diffusa TaxID=488732 RepID=UPI0020C6658E|nr:hypothetical protein [Burkholderia diffusa]